MRVQHNPIPLFSSRLPQPKQHHKPVLQPLSNDVVTFSSRVKSAPRFGAIAMPVVPYSILPAYKEALIEAMKQPPPAKSFYQQMVELQMANSIGPRAEGDGSTTKVSTKEALARTILRNNVVPIEGVVSDHMANDVYTRVALLISAMKRLNRREPIRFVITSPGGSILSLYKILEAMNMARQTKIKDHRDSHDEGENVIVETLVHGYAASAATVIANHGTPGHRFIGPDSEYMIHQPLGGAGGQETDIQIEAALIGRMRDKLERLYAINILKIHPYDEETQAQRKQEIDELQARVHEWCERDNWLPAKDAIEHGFLDGITPGFVDMGMAQGDMESIFGGDAGTELVELDTSSPSSEPDSSGTGEQ